MNTDLDINTLTKAVIGCAYRVGSALGSGFLEKVYENALALDLRKAGIAVEQQYALQVLYSGALLSGQNSNKFNWLAMTSSSDARGASVSN